jgi:hypothetical protein
MLMSEKGSEADIEPRRVNVAQVPVVDIKAHADGLRIVDQNVAGVSGSDYGGGSAGRSRRGKPRKNGGLGS